MTVGVVGFADCGLVVRDEIGDELDVFVHEVSAQGECSFAIAWDEMSTEPCGEQVGEDSALNFWGIVGEDFGDPPD